MWIIKIMKNTFAIVAITVLAACGGGSGDAVYGESEGLGFLGSNNIVDLDDVNQNPCYYQMLGTQDNYGIPDEFEEAERLPSGRVEVWWHFRALGFTKVWTLTQADYTCDIYEYTY